MVRILLRKAGAAALCLMLAAGCFTSTIRYGKGASFAGEAPKKHRYGSAGTETFGPVDPDRLKKICASYFGTPYRWGGMSKEGIDCSGLVGLVVRELNGTVLPRSSGDMFKLGTAVKLSELRAGDLVFFRWGFFGTVDHVGIVTGEGRFVHASSKRGVIESGLNDDYYHSHFVGGRRLFQ